MAWYRAGTVAVTNGSAVVTGTGTAFVSNVQPGHAINLPDGRAYEVLSVGSNTQITLGSPYLGTTAAGQAYSVQPNQGFAQSAASKLSDFLTQISGWVAGALAGRFGDGTLAAPGISFAADQDTGIVRVGANVLAVVTGGVQNVTVDASGNLLAGTPTGDAHFLAKGGTDDVVVARIGRSNSFAKAATFCIATNGSPSSSPAALSLSSSYTNQRSINTAGTVNTSGADYAEYMVKAAGCASIAKGQVCGVTNIGELTLTFADTVAFVIKSTSPSYVGGDTWSAIVGDRPEQADDEAESAFAARLASWEIDLEAARQQVDRIAFSGQVPVNVDDVTLAAIQAALADGETVYLIPVSQGAGIGVKAVRERDMTLPDYMRRVGKVWAVRDGQAWVDVQHG